MRWMLALMLACASCQGRDPGHDWVSAKDSPIRRGGQYSSSSLQEGCGIPYTEIPLCRDAPVQGSIERDNEVVTLHGVLMAQFSTLMLRPWMRSRVDGGGPMYVQVGTDKVEFTEPEFGCVGEQSALCCAFDGLGKKVAVRGTLRATPIKPGKVRYQIENAQLCRVGS